jgi:hypothetical protein
MARQSVCSAEVPSRDERVEALMEQLRPRVEQAVRKMVERAVDVPEAEEFGAIEYEFREAGQDLYGVRAGRQIPLVPAATAADGAWRSDRGAGLLLLSAVPSGFRAL